MATATTTPTIVPYARQRRYAIQRGYAWSLTRHEHFKALLEKPVLCNPCSAPAITLRRVDPFGAYALANLVPSCLRCAQSQGRRVGKDEKPNICEHCGSRNCAVCPSILFDQFEGDRLDYYGYAMASCVVNLNFANPHELPCCRSCQLPNCKNCETLAKEYFHGDFLSLRLHLRSVEKRQKYALKQATVRPYRKKNPATPGVPYGKFTWHVVNEDLSKLSPDLC